MDSFEHAERFLQVLRDHSLDKQDPVSEWTLLDRTGYDDDGKCICEKEIKNLFFLKNKITNEILIIGSDCAERWLNCALICKNCDTPLGDVMRRRKQQDFYCRLCKKRKSVADAIQFQFGKYRGKPWKTVAEDQKYVDWLINLPRKNPFIECFIEYCGKYYYNFEEELEEK